MSSKTATPDLVLEVDLPGLQFLRRGKVRDIFDLGEQLLVVTTDRISAFDHVLRQGIPGKGRVLTALSEFWFRRIEGLTRHHLVTTDVARMPEPVRRHADVLSGRTMLVEKAVVFPVECIVRGYLSGSGWKDYKKTGSVCGVALPKGLMESDRLPETIFTPSTKAETGHDENISFARMEEVIGRADAEELRQRSLRVYTDCARYAETRGILIADTKFEWGKHPKTGNILLVDEILSPDSSRFWPKEEYAPGRSQPSLDKQIVRDWLEGTGWDKTSPPPDLPDDIVRRTSEGYRAALKQLTGKDLSS